MQDNEDTTQKRIIWRRAALREQLSAETTFVDAANFEGGLDVELYQPVGTDKQGPHTRDELYFVTSGKGIFRRGDECVEFAAGDMLYVPAHMEHRFESFSDDFCTWVVFFGPEKDA